jgi:hypothetical protein
MEVNVWVNVYIVSMAVAFAFSLPIVIKEWVEEFCK